jgi:hypothetical protein
VDDAVGGAYFVLQLLPLALASSLVLLTLMCVHDRAIGLTALLKGTVG